MNYFAFLLVVIGLSVSSVFATTYTISGFRDTNGARYQKTVQKFIKEAQDDLNDNFSTMFVAKSYQRAIEDYDIILVKIQVGRRRYINMAIRETFDSPTYLTSIKYIGSKDFILEVTATLRPRE
ncbi:uncharacterized protein LOC120337351 [Styela clava]